MSQSNLSFKGKDYTLASSDITNFYNECVKKANIVAEYKFNNQQESSFDLIF